MSILGGVLVPHPPLIVPEVGKGQEREISDTVKSYHQAAKYLAGLAPETIVILTPHSTLYSDYIHISPGRSAEGSLGRFGAPARYRVDYDDELVAALEKACGRENIAAGTLGERDAALDHGTLVPLYFIGQYLDKYKIIRVAPSGLSREDHYKFGMALAGTAASLGRKIAVVCSGDLSHKLTTSGPYGYAPEGPALDEKLTGIMASGSFGELFDIDESLCSKGAECGYLPFLMLAGAFDGLAVRPRLLSYQGPFGVGYGVAIFEAGEADPGRDFLTRRLAHAKREMDDRRGREDLYVRLAREALESYVRTGKLPPLPGGLPRELTENRAGTFVSIKKRGQLRGCIGTISPTGKNIAEEIRQNAISSGARDPRFAPVEEWELEELVYSVDVLRPAEPADETMLDPQKYGVIVTSGHKRGLLLPNLEGVDTVEEQLSIARQKAGIPDGKAFDIQRFEVVRHT